VTLRLRPHHLLCLLTYAGKGYSPAFVANLDAVASRVASGETVEIVAGPDDICRPVAADPDHHCHAARIVRRDRLAARDVGRTLGFSLRPGRRLILASQVEGLRRLRGR